MSRRLSKRIDKLEKGRDTRRLSNPHLKYWEADLRRHRLQCEVIAGRLLSVADQAELDCLNELLAVEDRERGRLVELSIRELKYGSLSEEERREQAELEAKYPVDPTDPMYETIKAFGEALKKFRSQSSD